MSDVHCIDPHREYKRNATDQRVVESLPECDNQRCPNRAKYEFHTLYTEPAYCRIHFPGPPFFDLTYRELVDSPSDA